MGARGAGIKDSKSHPWEVRTALWVACPSAGAEACLGAGAPALDWLPVGQGAEAPCQVEPGEAWASEAFLHTSKSKGKTQSHDFIYCQTVYINVCIAVLLRDFLEMRGPPSGSLGRGADASPGRELICLYPILNLCNGGTTFYQ